MGKATGVSKDGGISRTGKIIPGTEVLGKGLEPGQYVDGEAFDPNLNFEELTSTFKTDPLKLKFHVFDFFDLRVQKQFVFAEWVVCFMDSHLLGIVIKYKVPFVVC